MQTIPLLKNEQVVTALQAQVGREQRNQNFYRLFTAWSDRAGYRHLTVRYRQQAVEEGQHSQRFMDFLTTSDCSILTLDVPMAEAPQASILGDPSLREWLVAALEAEEQTLDDLTSIMDDAMAANDYLTQTFMQDMLEEQRTEVHEARQMVTLVSNLSDPTMLEVVLDA